MTRDWELVKRILLRLEALESTRVYVMSDSIPGFSPEVVSYHIKILRQAGLIEADCSEALNTVMDCTATSMTWSGSLF